jgi:hypothetical protein
VLDEFGPMTVTDVAAELGVQYDVARSRILRMKNRRVVSETRVGNSRLSMRALVRRSPTGMRRGKPTLYNTHMRRTPFWWSPHLPSPASQRATHDPPLSCETRATGIEANAPRCGSAPWGGESATFGARFCARTSARDRTAPPHTDWQIALSRMLSGA